MGYSKSLRTIQRVKNHLDQMVASSERLEWPTTNPSKLSYWIRDGVNASRRYAVDSERRPVEPYASYARLGTKYIIKLDEGKVVAELRDVIPLPIEATGMGKMVLNELATEFELVGAATQHQAPEMFFPDASEDTCNMFLLHNWCQHNAYFIVSNASGITLTKTDPGDIAWTPG